jgi:hypothetical protein
MLLQQHQSNSCISNSLDIPQGSNAGFARRPAAAAGTLLPMPRGWGSLHPSADVVQRPVVLRCHKPRRLYMDDNMTTIRSKRAAVSQELGSTRTVNLSKSLEVLLYTINICI